MLNKIKKMIHFLLPKKFLTIFFGWFANISGGWITKIIIYIFVWYYKINIKEAQKTDISKYKTFNEFFSRNLKKDIRPYDSDPNVIIQPAEGKIVHLGIIEKNQIIQAKNHYYSLDSLLAEDYQISNHFYNGNYIVIYIGPENYHRVHMPCDGILKEMIYIPGNLFALHNTNVNNIPNLYARNERVICIFNTKFGLLAQILIGSTIVGSIETSWYGKVNSFREGIIKKWKWNKENNINLHKGEEMGLFKMGSTVITLFPPKKIEFLKDLYSGKKIYCRENLGILIE